MLQKCRDIGLLHALAGMALATLGVLLYLGFTVDDALISARVAEHLRSGLGYRFNSQGPVVDAVTPLGWAPLLSLFARGGAAGAFNAARLLGSLSWIAAAGFLARELKLAKGSPWPLLLLACSAPLGAWAQSGMETGVVIALVTLCVRNSRMGLFAAALAAGLRPELIPFAFVLALGHTQKIERVFGTLGTALGPAAAAALIRALCFGAPYPLSAAAKPPDLSPGLLYLAQTLLFGGPFWLWWGPGWKSLSRWYRWLAAATCAHLLAVALVGGDWMVLLRLSAPVFPVAIAVASQLMRERTLRSNLPTWVCAGAATAYLGLQTGVPGRHIVEQRATLIATTRPLLTRAKVVGTLDVGWVGLAHAGKIVDFAGVTNPDVAHLPGGHTTKRLESAWLRAQHLDYLILLLAPDTTVGDPWNVSHFARGVEGRAAHFAFERGCQVEHLVPLLGTHQSYVIVRCPFDT